MCLSTPKAESSTMSRRNHLRSRHPATSQLVVVALAVLISAMHQRACAGQSDLPPQYVENDVPAILAGLEAGLQHWLDTVTFSSTFTWECGEMDVTADPITGQFDGGVLKQASGQLHKSGQSVRSQYRFADAWTPVEQLPSLSTEGPMMRADARHFRNTPRDAGSANGVVVSYMEGHQDGERVHGNQVNIEVKQDKLLDSMLVAPTMWRSPISLGHGSVSALMHLSPINGDNTLEVTRSVSRVPDGTLLVKLSCKDAAFAEQREITIRMEANLPIIEEITEEWSWSGRISLRRLLFRDFRDCPGGSVAATVVDVEQSWREGAERPEKAMVCRWRSEDLGVRTPSDEDLIVVVPESAVILGTDKIPTAVNGVRRFDVRDYTTSDLWSTGESQPRDLASRQTLADAQGRSGISVPLVVLSAGLLLAILLMWFVSKRYSQGGPPALLLFILLGLHGCNQSSDETPHIVDTLHGRTLVLEAEAGPVLVGGTPVEVSHVFSITNPSTDSMMALSLAEKSCTCIDAVVQNKHVEPGETGKVTLTTAVGSGETEKPLSAVFETGLVEVPRAVLHLQCRALPKLSYECSMPPGLNTWQSGSNSFELVATAHSRSTEPADEITLVSEHEAILVEGIESTARQQLSNGLSQRSARFICRIDDLDAGKSNVGKNYFGQLRLKGNGETAIVPLQWGCTPPVEVSPAVLLIEPEAGELQHLEFSLTSTTPFTIISVLSPETKLIVPADVYGRSPMASHAVTLGIASPGETATNMSICIETNHPKQRKVVIPLCVL